MKMRSIRNREKFRGGPQISGNHWIRALTTTPWTLRVLDRLSHVADRGIADETPVQDASPVPAPSVLAVFERSCYAGSRPDLLLCLGIPEIGRAPLNLLVE